MTGADARSTMEELCFFGPNGSLTPNGDLVLETRAWRERLFTERDAATREGRSGLGGIVNRIFPGGGGGMFGGGQLALNQLLVVMDGIGEPRFMRKTLTRTLNTFLDATYVIPPRIGRMRLRLKKPRPAGEQIYFIGACNAPLESLDPALVRPGRMGRHVWFRTPTKDDRKDIFDLYLGKVDARGGPRLAEAARRARADHERLLAGDGRAGVLDGAHDRALRRPDGVRRGTTSSRR